MGQDNTKRKNHYELFERLIMLNSVITIVHNCIETMKTFGDRSKATTLFKSQIKKFAPDANDDEIGVALKENIFFVDDECSINLVNHEKH